MTKVSAAYLRDKGYAGKERLEEFAIFRANLTILQASRGVTAQELSRQMNLLTVKRVEDYKLGRSHPTWDEIRAIAKFFDVTLDQIMYQKAIIKFSDRDTVNTQICNVMAALVDRMFGGHIISAEDGKNIFQLIEKIKNSPQS